MPITNKTKKRLSLLIALVMVLAVTLGSVYFIRKTQNDKQAMAARAEGIQAYEDESYEEAVEKLSKFIRRHSDKATADDHYAYASSRLNVPLPNMRHLSEAIGHLERATGIDPDHTEATNLLLSLRLQVGQTIEATQLAESILAKDPTNSVAIETLILANQSSGKTDEAIAIAKDYQQLKPDEVSIARMLIRMMLQSPTHRIELAGQDGLLDDLRKQHANHPGFQLLLAQAYRALERDELADDCLTAAAEAPFTDNQTATEIAAEFMRDRSRGFEAAFAYIDNIIKSVEDGDVDQLRLWLAQQRLFLGQTDQAIELASQITPKSEQYIDGLALLALAASDAKDKSGVQAAQDKLAVIEDPRADAWAKVINHLMIQDKPIAHAVRPVLIDALKVDPTNHYFRYTLSLVYRDLGEPELAATNLVALVRSQPAWWAAAIDLANLFERSRDLGSAYQIVEQTYRLHPTVNPVRLRWAVLKSASLQPSDPESARETLDAIDQFKDEILLDYPEAKDTLAIARARCMGMLGRKDQLQGVLSDLATNSANPQIKLVAQQFADRFEVTLNTSSSAEADSPKDPLQIAFAQADILAANGDTDEAIATLKKAMAKAEMPQERQQRSLLAFMDNHSMSEALPLWEQAIEASPNSAAILRAAAASRVVLADKTLGAKVVEQLKQVTGEEGYAWRIAELKYKAEHSTSNTERSKLAEQLAALIRSGYNKPEARQLLATILTQVGNTRGALKQLTRAVEDNQYDAELNIALVKLAMIEQRYPIAKAALVRLTQVDNVKPAVMAEVARAADRLGQQDIASEIRSRPEVAPFLSPRENLARLQSALIAQSPSDSEIQALTSKLLASDNPALLRQLAITLALYSGTETAQPALEALSQKSADAPAILAKTQASIKEITGDPQAAFQILAQAVKQGFAEQDPELWAQYVRLLLAQPGGITQAAEALRKNPTSETDRAALDCLTRAQSKQDQRQGILIRMGLEALQADKPQVFQQAAKLIDEDTWQSDTSGQPSNRPGPSDTLLTELEALRAANPDQLNLYNQLTSLYIVEQRFTNAITLAQQTREAFPDDQISARLLTQAYAMTQQWRLVLGAAKAWRSIATPTRETLETIDLQTATALIEIGDTDTALNTIRGYTSDRAVRLATRAMIRSGRITEAEEIVFPLMRTDAPGWRIAAMQFAVTDVLTQDAQRAGAWLSEVQPLIPEDAINERFFWAQTSFGIGQKIGDRTRQREAFALMSSLSNHENFPATGWLLIGVYHDSEKQEDQAKQAYEQALAIDPNQHQAANNLANILLKRGELTSARELIDRALALTEDRPLANYIDTLAQIEVREGNDQKALELFAEAIRIAPENPLWYIDQAELLVKLDQRDEARDLLRRMKRWVPSMEDSEKQLVDRLEKLEEQLKD